jgi:hypothetical protein
MHLMPIGSLLAFGVLMKREIRRLPEHRAPAKKGFAPARLENKHR